MLRTDLVKKQLRQTMLKLQRSLPEDYVNAASGRIQQQVLASPQYQRARSLFTVNFQIN